MTNVDELWALLQDAKAVKDHALAARVKARMGQLQSVNRFANVSDAELERRVNALTSSKSIMKIKYAGMIEDSVQNMHVKELNELMKAGVEHDALDHLAELRAEQRRRQSSDA